ncbi:Uncharacterised protein g6837 [Pycnogonum litorale]
MVTLNRLIIVLLVTLSGYGCQDISIKIALVFEEGNKMIKDAVLAGINDINQASNNVQITYEMVEISSEPIYDAVCQQLHSLFTSKANKPLVVFDTTIGGQSSSAVKRIVRTLKIPTVSATYGFQGDIKEWKDLTSSEEQYLIQVMPPGDIIGQFVHDVGSSLNMSSAGILFDDSFVMKHRYKSILVNVPVRQLMQKVEKKNQQETQLSTYKKNGIVNFFIFASKDTVENLLNIGCRNEMTGAKYSWFIISKEPLRATIDCASMTMINVYPQVTEKVKLSNIAKDHNIRTDVDSIYYFELVRLLLNAVIEELPRSTWTNIQLAQCDSAGGTMTSTDDNSGKAAKLKSALKMVLHDTPYGKFIINTNGNTFMELTVKLEEYTVKNTSVHVHEIGSWFAGIPGMFSFKRGYSLQLYIAKKIYRITTVETAPFIIKKTDSEGNVYFDGYCIDLLKEIQKIVKFDYEIFEAHDNAYGAVNDNGDWNGMISELIDKKADIALAPISVMAERENVVDFTVPYYDLVGITILMKKPKPPTSLFKFLNVLETQVWLCILGVYFVTSILMFAFDRWSPYSLRNNQQKYADTDERRDFNIKECLWFCMTSLTPQGGGEAPKNISGRLVAATWWLFGFIVIASYTANLAAFLTVSRLDSSITSLDDLAKQYKFQYAPSNGTSSMTYFQRMADIEEKFYEIWKDMSLNESMDEVERAKLAVWDYPVSDKYTRIWNAIKQAGLPNNSISGVERTRTEAFAYIGDATEIKWATTTDCDFEAIGDEFSRKPYAIAVQKDSPLKDQFSGAILQLLNVRTLETLKEKWWDKNPQRKNCEDIESTSDGISISNIGGVFIVIFIGIGLASVSLMIEYWYYRKQEPVTQGPLFTTSRKTKVVAISRDNHHDELISYKH